MATLSMAVTEHLTQTMSEGEDLLWLMDSGVLVHSCGKAQQSKGTHNVVARKERWDGGGGGGGGGGGVCV